MFDMLPLIYLFIYTSVLIDAIWIALYYLHIARGEAGAPLFVALVVIGTVVADSIAQAMYPPAPTPQHDADDTE